MTRQRTFKRLVRARMAKTGESYTAARRMLIAAGDQPSRPAEVGEVVEALLSTWSGADQARLVSVLRELHAMTGAGRRR